MVAAAKEWLEELRRRDIRLWSDAGQLRFSAPAGTLTPTLREELRARKTELLAALSDTRTATIPTADRGAPLPLSFAQERLWILDRLEPGLSLYSVAQGWRIRGHPNADAIEKALLEIARRHEVLRTTFTTDEGESPRQQIHPPSADTLDIITLEGSGEDRETALLNAIASEANSCFDLTGGPLWRAKLLRIGSDDHVLLLTWHHIIFDAWSSGIFARELTALYAAFDKQQPNPLPEISIQYADFAEWQRRELARPTVQEQFAWWRSQLAGERAPLALPFDRPRPLRQSHRGATQSRSLSNDLTARLRELSHEEGATIFMTLLAAFKTLLRRYTGDTDLWIGSPIAQRPFPETEELIGFFLNMLVLRTDAGGHPSFRELLHRVRTTVLDAFARQDVPFEKLVEELHPARDVGHHPLFQVAFVLQPEDGDSLILQGLTIEPVAPPVTTAKFDLTLFVKETSAGLRATFEYATDLFDEATIDRLLASLELLLDGVVAQPDVPISRLPILSSKERRLLQEWNNTAAPFPHDRTVHELFEEWARRTPDALAVVEGLRSVTYRELNAAADQIATHLQHRGLAAGDLVGLPAVRKTTFVAAVLGILKAGGAYVPFDSKEAPDRLALIKATCRVVLDLDSAWEGSSRTPPTVTGASSAYVLYTSGSTGTPKGVIVPHRAINRLVVNSDYVRLQADDVIAFASNPCFDATTFELWGALLNGGTLVITPKEVLLSPTALGEHLAEHRITTLFLTTSLFNQIAQQAPAILHSLRHLLFGGEVADPHSVRQVLEHGRPGRLVHVYGPTEATTFAAWYLVEEAPGPRVPIGRPIANTTIYILDEALEPVPIGVTGEIYIGGPGAALGYHAAPDLTAEKFIRTSFGRVYRTGDRARWLPDGTIDFLGRADEQIKLRGFRIEPGEIEAALRKVPSVRECHVLLREIEPGEQRLVAYFIAASTEPCPAELREILARSIPAHMIPNAFVPVDHFPLTANGKLHVSALPQPAGNGTRRKEFTGPENTLHAQLIEIWEQVLSRRPIGITDNFFELGGHSLLAAKMLAIVEERLGKRVPLTVLFGEATIRQVASSLFDEQQRIAPEMPITTIQESGTKRALFFLHGDFVGGGFYCKNLARHIGSDRPFFAVHPHGLQGAQPPGSIEEMAAARLADLRTVQPEGPYLLGGYCNGALVAYEMARQLGAHGQTVSAVVMLAADGSNARYHKMKRAALWAGAVMRDSSDQKQRRFVNWQRRAELGHALAKYYGDAALDLWRQPPREQAVRLWRKTRRVLRRFVGGEVSERTQPRINGCAPATERAAPRTALAYENAFASYVPGPYHGRIILLWPHEQPAVLPEGPAGGWSHVCRDVRLVLVPGEHHSSVALDSYLQVIGEQIRAALDETERAFPSSPNVPV